VHNRAGGAERPHLLVGPCDCRCEIDVMPRQGVSTLQGLREGVDAMSQSNQESSPHHGALSGVGDSQREHVSSSLHGLMRKAVTQDGSCLLDGDVYSTPHG